MKNVIYKIRNVTNQHYYIGSTVDSRKRFWEHRKDLRLGVHVCIRLQRAWDKYGEDCFKFEVIEQLASREELYPTEQKWLNEHYGTDYCYNVSPNADSPMRNASPEMRARLSAKAKAWAAIHGHPREGTSHTEENRARISEGRTGKTTGPDHYRYGKTVSLEVRKKIGDTQRGKPKGPGRKVSPEGMAKIRAAAEAGHYSHWEGRKHKPESIAKMSRPVIWTDANGHETRFESITELRKTHGLTPTSVNRAIKSGKPIARGPHAGVSIRYA